MSKMLVNWHKECLNRQYETLVRKKQELERLQVEVVRIEQETTFYHVQVHEVGVQGKVSFDAERFLLKEKKFYVK